jgi:signal transduction histidine kinase
MPAQRSLIARKLTRLIVLATGTALGFACLLLMVEDFFSFRAAMVRNRTIQARIVAMNTVTSLLFDDPDTAEQTLASLGVATRIEAAGLYRSDGRIFASYVREAAVERLVFPGLPPGADTTHTFDFPHHLHLVHPIVFEGKPIGAVYIRSDLQEILDRMTRYLFLIGGVLLLSTGAALLVSRVLRRSISRPIVELADVATRITEARDYSVRPRVEGKGEVAVLVSAFNDMLAQIQARDRSLQESYDLLDERVQTRTAELHALNKELEAFCYSVSHDLRSPLRTIDGFSLALLEDHGEHLPGDAQDHLHRIRAATQRMGVLIDDLLNLSRITRTNLHAETVDMSGLARTVVAELAAMQPGRQVETSIEDHMTANADARLVRLVYDNLIGNAWKFTSREPAARIDVGTANRGGVQTFFVSDNGAGFDPAYTDRLFGVFQRLHAMTDFPGTGVGLAIVDRIVQRHGGRVWADGAVGRGATFYFTLSPSPVAQQSDPPAG